MSLRTTYMGIELKNPLIVGACSLSRQVDTIKQLEDVGAGALVIKSLFEEAIRIEQGRLEEDLSAYDALYSEALSMFPNVEHGGPKEHLYFIERAAKATGLPLFASLNATSDDIWVDYAIQLANSGVKGLELNFYSPPIDPSVSSDEIEKRELETFAKVRAAVKLPIAVKLHSSYTNLMRVATAFDAAGADALVLFNRLFQPDVDIDKESEAKVLHLSSSVDALVPLRWTALLNGRIKADIAASSGIMDGADAVKLLLAGASAVQVVSALYRHKIGQIGKMALDIEKWMKGKGYKEISDFRGKLSKGTLKDAWAHERGQYIKALLGFD